MSFLPTFELGLWNAWIFILPIIILSFFGQRIIGSRESEEENVYTKREKTLFRIYMVIIGVSYAYSVFLPFRLGTIWFYAGLCIYVPSIIMGIMAVLSFATTPVNQPVTTGVYRISRNPMSVGEVLIYVSIGIACVSWIFLLLAIGASIIGYKSILAEERFCLNKYGNAYREYMHRTPRWIGIPRIRKSNLDE